MRFNYYQVNYITIPAIPSGYKKRLYKALKIAVDHRRPC